MSWFGLARRISHWVLGGRNASHVAPLPIQVVGVEFAKVDNYMKAKVAELPRDKQPFFEFFWQTFSKLWNDFQKLRFENFPQLAAEFEGLKAQIKSYEQRKVHPPEELSAKFDVTKQTFNYQLKTMRGDLLNLGMKLQVFGNQTNQALAADFAKNLAPLVHGIAKVAKIDLDSSSYLEIF